MTSTNRLNDMNTNLIMKAIHDHAPISRAELSERVDLAPSTVSVITGKLQEKNFIRECGNVSSGGGRPAVLLEINPEGGYFIGIDLRGTQMAIGILNLALRIQDEWSYIIPTEGGEQLYEQLVKAISDVKGLCRERGFPILGIGVATPGMIEPGTGKVIEADNFKWYEFNLKERLQEEFECLVVVENDANASAYGEFLYGVGREKGMKNIMYMSVGTGIGSGFIINGQLYTGRKGMAGEIGHIMMDPLGKLCVCGKKGCLTAYASVPRMIEEYNRQAAQPINLRGEPSKLFSVAEAGDEVAERIISEAGLKLGIAAGNQVNLLNLDGVVFGGIVFEHGNKMLEAVKEGLKLTVLPSLLEEININLGVFSSSVGMVGVTALSVREILSARSSGFLSKIK